MVPGDSPLAAATALGLPALAELLTRTEDGIAVVDADRRFVYANPAACRMLGHPLGAPARQGLPRQRPGP